MGLAGVLGNSFAHNFLGDDRINHLLHIILVSIVATLAFIVAAQFFRVPEWDWLRDKILRRRKPAASA
jgi:hypothetical protein